MPLTHAVIFMLLYIVFTKPAYLTAGTWPFSIDFNNNFGYGTKKMHAGEAGKLLYYKSWPYNESHQDES